MSKTTKSSLICLALGVSLISVAEARPEDEDGVQNIVNGRELGIDEFLETVQISSSTPGSQGGNCTGTLIAPTWVLTAAHCFEDGRDDNLATVNFGNSKFAPIRSVDSINVYTHPDYVGSSDGRIAGTDVDDIAVIELEEPVLDTVPAGLNPDPLDNEWAEREVDYVGFGITQEGGSDDGIKRIATETLTSFTTEELSTFADRQGTCQGDSGGPGFVRFGEEYIQVAIVSRGEGCAEQNVGIATRVDAYLDWLDEFEIPYSTKPGSAPSFVCSNRLNEEEQDSVAVGNIPFDIRCAVTFTDTDDVASARWAWGDGTTSEGKVVTHEYTTDGNFTVRMCADATEDAGGWQHCVTRISHVRACDVPDVAFSYETLDDDTVQFINQTDLRTWGCIFDVQWDIFEGSDTSGEPIDSITAWEPLYTFEEKGNYTVVLNVGGLAGVSAAMVNLDSGSAGACSHTGAAGGFGLLSLGLLLVGTRRREY